MAVSPVSGGQAQSGSDPFTDGTSDEVSIGMFKNLVQSNQQMSQEFWKQIKENDADQNEAGF